VTPLFRYDKPGAGVVLYPDRLEITTGALWKKQTHTVLLKSVTGVSVEGMGGHILRIDTAGASYRATVGVGVGNQLRERILDELSRRG